MNSHFGTKVLKAATDSLDGPFGRVVCVELDTNRVFTWEACQPCGCCGNTGELIGKDAKPVACPLCDDEDVELLYTDYDGNLIEEPA